MFAIGANGRQNYRPFFCITPGVRVTGLKLSSELIGEFSGGGGGGGGYGGRRERRLIFLYMYYFSMVTGFQLLVNTVQAVLPTNPNEYYTHSYPMQKP
jgi:hypothetical protein